MDSRRLSVAGIIDATESASVCLPTVERCRQPLAAFGHKVVILTATAERPDLSPQRTFVIIPKSDVVQAYEPIAAPELSSG